MEGGDPNIINKKLILLLFSNRKILSPQSVSIWNAAWHGLHLKPQKRLNKKIVKICLLKKKKKAFPTQKVLMEVDQPVLR